MNKKIINYLSMKGINPKLIGYTLLSQAIKETLATKWSARNKNIIQKVADRNNLTLDYTTTLMLKAMYSGDNNKNIQLDDFIETGGIYAAGGYFGQ